MNALNSNGGDSDVPVPPEIAAEAAVWIARLHGPSRSPAMEREFRAWQSRSASHRKAFERSTDIWEAVPRIRLQDAYGSASVQGIGQRPRWRIIGRRSMMAVVPALLVTAAAYLWISGRDTPYATKVGEQQLVVLDDGSRMTLNTNTQLRVKLGSAERSVFVEQGEALFEVAKDAHRPFVVHAAGTQVVAVGTVFSVRLAEDREHRADALAVALVEGQVSVRPDSGASAKGLAPASAVLMNAGDRFRLSKAAVSGSVAMQQLDRPRMDPLLAWKRSEAVFDDVALSDAVAEMNRYSRMPIALLGGDAISHLRVSGLYRTGDNRSFAKAVGALHGLTLQEREGRLELSLPH